MIVYCIPCRIDFIRFLESSIWNMSNLDKDKTFFGPQMNSYKWYILIDEERKERHSKYETKDFNCLIEIWPIYGSYFTSVSSSELSKSKKTSLTVLAGIWLSSSKYWTYSRYYVTVNRINKLYQIYFRYYLINLNVCGDSPHQRSNSLGFAWAPCEFSLNRTSI